MLKMKINSSLLRAFLAFTILIYNEVVFWFSIIAFLFLLTFPSKCIYILTLYMIIFITMKILIATYKNLDKK